MVLVQATPISQAATLAVRPNMLVCQLVSTCILPHAFLYLSGYEECLTKKTLLHALKQVMQMYLWCRECSSNVDVLQGHSHCAGVAMQRT